MRNYGEDLLKKVPITKMLWENVPIKEMLWENVPITKMLWEKASDPRASERSSATKSQLSRHYRKKYFLVSQQSGYLDVQVG